MDQPIRQVTTRPARFVALVEIRGRLLAICLFRPTAITFLTLAAVFAPVDATRAAEKLSRDESDRFFAREDVPSIQVEIPAAGMEILRGYEFRRDGNRETRTNVAATIREGGRVWTNVAVHLKGSLGSFRDVDDRPGLTVNFDKWVDGQEFHGLRKISLNNSVQDGSYASEIVSREVFRKAGLPAPRALPARVSLNGRDLGLYLVLEGWNRQFLRRHFSDPHGALWDCGTARDIDKDLDTLGDDVVDRRKLDLLAEACAETNLNVRLERMGVVVDLDRFFKMMATEVMLMHWDGYALNRNNYRVFHDRSIDRLVFLPQGMDQMFGQFRNWRPTSSIKPMMKGLVARAIMQVPAGRRRYLQAMEQMLNTAYDVPAMIRQIDTITERLQLALASDLVPRARQMAMAGGLKERIVQRAASVQAQLKTETTPVAFGPDGTFALTEWRSSYESGSPSFRRRATPEETLEVTAPDRIAHGSWRAEVFLDEGAYQFVGRLKLVDAGFSAAQSATNQGVTLRLSGDRNATLIRDAPDWRTVTYDFRVTGQEDLVLVCEFYALKGTAMFDATSLKLIRKQVAR